ncbi:sigma-70 family RNA polymerase sigma factor [Gimesia aquarii]|uniref:RNA polymerase factor sigma-70 n=1 Tax=Gimesia aquarii TaxID=2527964 RepID=A0A517VX07_9PLAN|nr:sigma-70 family RNA polymerase sigma factor [Gimesia aquarii]QDT97522.1 RNA polymerase factor sigma-70 [Gimesia aquarii]
MKPSGNVFAKLMVTYDRELLRYIMMLIPRRDDAEEVLQRTALVLWEKFEEYDQTRDFLPWATRFAYFESLNFRKECARSRLIFSEEIMSLLTQSRKEQESYLSQRRSALKQCLAELSTEDRNMLERRYTDSSTIKSLAEEQGRTVKALYRRLDRVRKLISDCIERRVAALDRI